eukprot:jgi/Mesvir1/15271/Mv06489-RA.1
MALRPAVMKNLWPCLPLLAAWLMIATYPAVAVTTSCFRKQCTANDIRVGQLVNVDTGSDRCESATDTVTFTADWVITKGPDSIRYDVGVWISNDGINLGDLQVCVGGEDIFALKLIIRNTITRSFCNDGDKCTSDTCNRSAGCVNAPICQSEACCCPDGTCVPKIPGVDCDFTCSNAACSAKGTANIKCKCIKDCKGNTCSSVLGNPCRSNGVCCCAIGTSTSNPPNPNSKYIQNCVDCSQPCGSRPNQVCLGNYYHGTIPQLKDVCDEAIF